MTENLPQETQSVALPRRSRLKNLAMGLALLISGAAIGSVTTAVVMERHPVREMRREANLPSVLADRMQAKYGLSGDDRRRIEGIFEEHRKNLADIRAEVQPRVDAEHEALREGIETVLTPDQAADWHNEFEQMRRRWHGRNAPASPPGSK